MRERQIFKRIPETQTSSLCPRCEAPFKCGASLFGCWCFDYRLTPEMREFIRQRYRGCLCPRCLEHFGMIGE